MAAQPIGRYCACGCAQSIDHMRRDAKWLPGHNRAVALERQREYDKQRTTRKRPTPSVLRQRAARKALCRLDHNVYSAERNGLPPPPRQKICGVCCGMPWARLPARFPDSTSVEKDPVAGDNLLCRGCGESYSPEPKPEPAETLRSSGGMAARLGELHGYTTERGQNMKTLSREPEGRGPRKER